MTSKKWNGILRCKTFDVWPARTTSELPPVDIHYGSTAPVRVHTLVTAYDPKLQPALNLIEPSDLGPSLWDGDQPRFHRIWDALLLGVGETIQLSQPDPRTARRGELDIQLGFDLDGDPSKPLVEALRAHAYEMLAVLNLQLADFLIPTMPFLLCKVLPGDEIEVDLDFKVEVRNRQTLTDEALGQGLLGIAHFLSSPTYAERYRVALEVYEAHFTEQQVRVRFILLVIGMEALAESAPKHQVAQNLLVRFQEEIATERSKYDPSSEEFFSLDALSRELDFRSKDSINNTIRKLFASLPGLSNEESLALQRQAVRVYNKRSKLVHEGYLPPEELPGLEAEARTLLEMLLKAAIEQSKPENDRFRIEVKDPPAPQTKRETK